MNSSTARVECPIVQRICDILVVVMAYCLLRPSCELVRTFDDIHRYFVVGLERLFGVRSERFHAVNFVGGNGCRRDFEVEPPLVNYAEKRAPFIESVSAEHGVPQDYGQARQWYEFASDTEIL